MIEFLIDPVAKPRMTQRDKWAHRKCVDEYFRFKDALVLLAKQKKFVLGDKYKVEFLIQMPQSWSNKRKLHMLGKPHQAKPDLDNLLKSINDCFKVNDAVIYMIEATKLWWEEGKIIFYDIKEV